MTRALTIAASNAHAGVRTSGPSFSVVGSCAFATSARASFLDSQILAFVRMSVGTMSPAGQVLSGIPARHVDCARDGLQVSRIDATTDTAQVVKVESFRNRPAQQLVRESVSGLYFAPVSNPTVPKTNSSHPNPTAGLGDLLNVCEQVIMGVFVGGVVWHFAQDNHSAYPASEVVP